jgi:hypothetical protein
MSKAETFALAKRSAVLIGVLAALTYWPVLIGWVPLPADAILQFPPWESVRPPVLDVAPRAETGDLVTELYPWKAFEKRNIAEGHFPLWNRHLFLGAPYLADPQTGVFYPPNLLYLAFPTPLAWSLSFLLRTVLAGVFTSLLADALGASRRASLLAGVVFALCGWVTSFQARPHLDTCLWIPLALFATDRLQRRPSPRAVGLAAAAFALPVVAGQVESAAHVTLVALLFLLYRLMWPAPGSEDGPPAGRMRFVCLFAAAGVLAVGLAAAQIVPTLQWIGLLNRNLQMSWGPRPLHEIVALLSRDLRANPNSAGIAVPEGAAYVGMLALLLAPLAFFHRNRRDAIFFATLVAICLQIIYGLGPVYALSLRIPILNGIPNGRLLAVVDLGLAVLAALGLTAITERAREAGAFEPRWWWLPTMTFAAGALGVGLLLHRWKPLREFAVLSPAGLRSPWGSAVFLLGAGVLMILGLSGGLEASRFALFAVAFCAADLVSASYKFLPFAKTTEIFPPAPTFQFLQSEREPFRVASVNRAYGSSFEMMYGLDTPTGFNVVLLRPRQLLGAFGFDDNSPYFDAQRIARADDRLLDLMNVKYLVATTWNDGASRIAARPDRFRLVFSDWSVRVFQNLGVLPRAFLVPAGGIRTVARDEAQLQAVLDPAFDPAASVILPEAPVFPKSDRIRSPLSAPRVGDVAFGADTVSLRADVTEPSVLVVSQAHYPGWKAWVDGAPAPLLRADYAFVGVPLGTGVHGVRLAFRPTAPLFGVAVSLIAVVITLRLSLAGGTGELLRFFSILVAAAALLAGVRALRERAWLFGAPPLRVYSPAFLNQVRAVEARIPPGEVLLFAGTSPNDWNFILWSRALYPRNDVVVLEPPVIAHRRALLREKYGARFAIAAGGPAPDPGFLWSVDLGPSPHAEESRFGELSP